MSALHPGLQDNEILLSLFETFESSDSIKIHQLAEITNTYDD